MVYPALTSLKTSAIGHVITEGNKKRHEPADAGCAYRRRTASGWSTWSPGCATRARWTSLRRAMSGESQREPEQGGWRPSSWRRACAIKRALTQRSEASADEQRRIAAILARAADEIEAGQPWNLFHKVFHDDFP